MNKTELVERIARDSSVNKVQAKAVYDSIVETIKTELQAGGSVVLPGFGTFEVRNRAAREGRNPQTGEPIQIKASKLPAFKAGKTLKDALKA
jgi:DNA-binding protein HU-beta